MTDWRRIESRANYSLPKFPTNREKYREYRAFLRTLHEVSTYPSVFWWSICVLTANRNRDRTGGEQGMNIPCYEVCGQLGGSEQIGESN